MVAASSTGNPLQTGAGGFIARTTELRYSCEHVKRNAANRSERMMSQKSKTCTGKKTGAPLTEYGSESDARAAAVYASANYKRNLSPYLCRVCNKWHLSPTNRQTPSEKCTYCVGGDGQQKDAYDTEKAAKLRATIIRKESGVSLRAYECKFGNGWHLTKS